METALPAVVLQQHHADKYQSYVPVECVHDILIFLLDLLVRFTAGQQKTRLRMAGLISPSERLGGNEALGKDQGETQQIYVDDVLHHVPNIFDCLFDDRLYNFFRYIARKIFLF
jgi:hypothetical protein